VLSFFAYASGALELIAVAAAAGAGAARLRGRLLPAWSGSPAWLATSVLALALVILTAELLGTAGVLAESTFVPLAVLAGLALRFGVTPVPRSGGGPPAPDAGPLLTAGGLAFAALALAHFSIGTRISLGEGMSGFDSTWYHGPFAAGFAENGSTLDLHLIAPQYLAWFYPQNSELVHAFGILAFDRDVMSPLLGICWLAGCLAAAWCIGRPWGTAPISMAASALVLGAGVLGDQAGEARNDIVATFFILAGAAVAANGWRPDRDGARLEAGSLVVAGLAAGLAAGTKVNFLAPALALVVGLALLRPDRRRALALAGLPALAGGAYWYLRNLVQAGNPLPWVKQIGPIPLPAPDQELGGREAHGVLDYAFDPGVWADWFGPGLRDGLGLLWPLTVALAAAGIGLCLTTRSDPIRRVLAVTALAAVAAWVVAPASAEGPEGSPVGFVSGLRYLAPGMAIGLALAPTAAVLAAPQRRWALLGVCAAVMPFADASSEPWPGSYVPGAALVGLAVAAGAFALARGDHRSVARPLVAAGGAAALVLAIAAGHLLQRSYLDNRYEDPAFTTPGLDAAFAWGRGLRGESVATTATRQYPLWGTDLSNDVTFVGAEQPHGGYVRPAGCVGFRRAVGRTGARFLVLALDRFERGGPRFPREAAWVKGAPGVRIVLRRAPAAVFALSRPLDPGGC